MSSSYHVRVISQRFFKELPKDRPDLSIKLTKKLTELRELAKTYTGYIDSDTYKLSQFAEVVQSTEIPQTPEEFMARPNSFIVSKWKDEIAWQEFFNSSARQNIAKEIEPFQLRSDEHMVLSKVRRDLPLL